MHDDGEVDARGTYTVIAIASLLNMLTPELAEGVAEFTVRMQTEPPFLNENKPKTKAAPSFLATNCNLRGITLFFSFVEGLRNKTYGKMKCGQHTRPAHTR